MLNCLLFLTVSAIEVALLVSQQTPFPISQVLSLATVPASVSLSVHTVTNLTFPLQQDLPIDAVLDYSYAPASWLPCLHDFQTTLLIDMYSNSLQYELRGRVTAQSLANHVSALLSSLNLTKAFLAGAVPKYADSLHLLSESFGLFEEVERLHDLSEADLELFVGRLLKPAGRTVAVLLVEQNTGKLLIPLLRKYHIYQKGFVYLLSDEAAWGQTAEGLLYFTDSAAIEATDRISYEALILTDRLQQLESCLLLPRKDSSLCFQPTLSLMNIVNGRAQLVGNSSIVFPGNSTTVPKVQKPAIHIWAELEGLSYDGSVYPLWKAMSRGTILGYNEVNLRPDMVPTYQFINHSVSFGAMKFNKTWAISHIQNALISPAIAYHGFLLTATILRLYRTFQDMGLNLPMSALSTSPFLSDPMRFPLFFRTVSSSAASALVMSRFFQLWGWKQVAIVYSAGKGDVDFYAYFLNITRDHRVQIANAETKRQVPLDLSTGEAELNDTLWDILNSTVRVIVISHTFSYKVAARLYDLGARPGDYMICLNYGLSYNQFGGSDDTSRKARLVMRGAMAFRDHYFSGTQGPHVRAQLQAIDGTGYDPEGCVCYDSAMLVAHTVHYMLYKGRHFEEGLELAKAIRGTRFQGCMGVVQIENESNDIRPWEFSVTNVHLIGENETLELAEVAIYSPTKVQLYSISPELQFPDGSNVSFPDTWETDTVCPYLIKDIRDFPRGQLLAIGVCFSYAAVMVIILVVYICKSSTVKLVSLTKREVMSARDGLAFYEFCVEFLQLLALAPELDLPPTLRNILAIFSLNVWDFIQFSQGVYLGLMGTALALISVYLVLFLAIKLIKGNLRIRKCALCKLVKSWSKCVHQPLSTLCFFPITSSLLALFVCDRATGPAFTDSFLAVDCWEGCWSGTHLQFSLVSAVLLCLYTPIAILTRSMWQDIYHHLHIKSSKLGVVSKAILQLVLIASFVSLREKYPTVHAIVFMISTVSYSIWVHFMKSYNYERLNLWEKLAMLGVCIYGILCLIKVKHPSIPSIWLLCPLYISYFLLFTVGAILQCLLPKYHSRLRREKEDRYDIIKFAFTFGSRAQQHLQAFHLKCKQRKDLFASEQDFGSRSQVPRRVPQTNLQSDLAKTEIEMAFK